MNIITTLCTFRLCRYYNCGVVCTSSVFCLPASISSYRGPWLFLAGFSSRQCLFRSPDVDVTVVTSCAADRTGAADSSMSAELVVWLGAPSRLGPGASSGAKVEFKFWRPSALLARLAIVIALASKAGARFRHGQPKVNGLDSFSAGPTLARWLPDPPPARKQRAGMTASA